MFKIAVLASTRGTDIQAIIDELKGNKMPGIELKLVVSNKKNSYALQRAKEQGFKTLFVDPGNKTPEEYDLKLINELKKHEVDLVVLVGYMRILTPAFIQAFSHKIINVHPALIPKYCGKEFYGNNVHEAVLASGDKETGMTIHYVDEGVDTGEIILQKPCPVYPSDTADTLKERVQDLEKKYYPEVIRQIASKSETNNK